VSSSTPSRVFPLPLPWKGRDARVRELSDEDVLARLQADSGALQILFDRYSRLVLDVGLRVLRDRGEAEEIVQDVFFYIYRKAGLFDPSKGVVKAWIVHIAYHRALDRRAYLTRRGFYVGTNIDSLDDSLLGATDLEHEVGAKLSRAKLENAFHRLPELQRKTLELYYFEGLELREISEELDEPLGNVRHHFYRGLERLRQCASVRKLRET
jgi:RNA polymerase sigma-70 factor, ECF subfamily